MVMFEGLQEMQYYREVLFAIWLGVLCLMFVVTRAVLSYYISKDREQRADLWPVLKSTSNWVMFYAVMILVMIYYGEAGWLNQPLFEMGGETSVTPLTLIIALMIITLGFRLAQLLSRFIVGPSLRAYNVDRGIEYTLTRVTQYVVMALALVIGFMNLGLDLTALTIFASMIGVGIGFGLQNIASNFFSGIIILFERPFKVGDVVKFGETLCEVEEIKIRSTVVRTFDGERIIVPNSLFVENEITNLNYSDEKMRVNVPIGVAYGSDVLLVRELLLQAASEQPDVLAEPPPAVHFLNYGDSSLDFRVVCWVPTPSQRFSTFSAMNFRIYELFAEHDIEIPFPQRDLHLRSVDPQVLAALQKREGSSELG